MLEESYLHFVIHLRFSNCNEDDCWRFSYFSDPIKSDWPSISLTSIGRLRVDCKTIRKNHGKLQI